jgi:hypothetical protein
MKHGVIIIPHKKWNTKQIWSNGHLMRTYRHQPKHLHFKSPMVNDANQDLCGGWSMGDCNFEEEQMRIIDRVSERLKPMGILHYDSRALADKVADTIRRNSDLDVKVIKKHNYQVALAQHGTLEGLFDLMALRRDYVENGVLPKEVIDRDFDQYGDSYLIDFAEKEWDVEEEFPMWLTGLMLGYPIENTISIYFE